jgi:guanylate kinase
MQYPGTLALIVGVSGSGKGALMAAARTAFPDAVFPVSCTTRALRPGEVAGETYEFVTDAEFDARSARGDFLEWAHYGGHRYGTAKGEILNALTQGKLVLREVEVQGARHIRDALPKENVVSIFIHAGTWELLAARIQARAPISEEELAKRRERYEDEMSFQAEADHVLENRDGALAEATAAFTTLLASIAP